MTTEPLQAESKYVVAYLRRSPRDTLKKDAADIIEQQEERIRLLERQIRDLAAFREAHNQ